MEPPNEQIKTPKSSKKASSGEGVTFLGKKKWTRQDDLLLKEGMQNLGDYEKTAKNFKFSSKFNAKELEERWRALLYDPKVSEEAAREMAELPALNKRVLWDEAEEEILRKEVKGSQSISFQQILEKYRTQFHSSRTAKSLEAHYYRMKRTGTLKVDEPQTSSPSVSGSPINSFSFSSQLSISNPPSLNSSLNSENLFESTEDSAGNNELSNKKRKLWQVTETDLSDLEQELEREANLDESEDGPKKRTKQYLLEEKKQQNMVLRAEQEYEREKETEYEPRVLAIFRGRKLRYKMKTKEILIGRQTKDNFVDVNLSEEGNASKVSRRQAIIKLKRDGEFYVKNIGNRIIFLNGKPIEMNQKKRLTHNSFLEIYCLQFIFEINKVLLSKIKKQLM